MADIDQEILQIAAWFHDTGYVKGWEDHEIVSGEIAGRFLKAENYPSDRIKKVIDCILATRMPQQPVCLLERIICDADLFNLSQPSYFKKSLLLRAEMEQTKNLILSTAEFLQNEISFLTQHCYHSAFGKVYLDKRKAKNIAFLREQLRVCREKGK